MSILTLAATLRLLGPVTLESGKFTVTQDGKKVGTEQFTRHENSCPEATIIGTAAFLALSPYQFGTK